LAGTARDFEARLLLYSGREIAGQISTRATREVDGKILFYEGILQDIANRRKAEAQNKSPAPVLACLQSTA
jgi:hypothetical protein